MPASMAKQRLNRLELERAPDGLPGTRSKEAYAIAFTCNAPWTPNFSSPSLAHPPKTYQKMVA